MVKTSLLIWLALILGFVAFAGVGISSLPETIGTRFNLQGQMVQTGSILSVALPLIGLMIFVQSIFLALYLWIDKLPVSNVKMPNKEFWISDPARIQLAYTKLRTVSCVSGILCSVTMFAVLNDVFAKNGSSVSVAIPSLAVLLLITGLFISFVYWTLRTFREDK